MVKAPGWGGWVVFDVEAFRAWSIGARGRAPVTMRGDLQRLRALQRVGLDVEGFLESPGEAAGQAARALAAIKDGGGTAETARSCGKALNWLLQYAAHLRPGLTWPKLKLEKEPRRTGRTVSAMDLARLARHVGPNEYVTRLRRAVLAVAVVTRLRRSEVARLRVQDLRRAAGEVWVEFPAKRGPKRAIVVPKALWSPGGPLAAYLALREPVGSALWTMPHNRGGRARRITVAALGVQLGRMGEGEGIPISFVRTRRFGATLLDDLGVHPRVIQHQLGHTSLTWTMRYLGEVGKDRILSEYVRCRVPGFEGLRRSGVRAERMRAEQASRHAVQVVLAARR
jgi:integrase